MKFAITPCPNDTFSYEALISKKIKSGFEFEFADIEELNIAAENGKYPLTKMSFPAYIKNSDKYELLDAGAALGMGTGPILVVKKGGKFDPSKPVLVPGLNTTAAALLKFYAGGDIEMKAAYFRDISSAISAGEADAGVLIHEGRFVPTRAWSSPPTSEAFGQCARGFRCRSAAFASAKMSLSAKSRSRALSAKASRLLLKIQKPRASS